MTDDQGEAIRERRRSVGVEAFLFLLALGHAFLAVALTFATMRESSGGLSGIACGIVSAGALIALAIERSR